MMSEINPLSRAFQAAGEAALDVTIGVIRDRATDLGIIPKGEVSKVENIPGFIMDQAKNTLPLAQAVYDETGAPEGWTRENPDALKNRFPELQDINFSDEKTGFHADLFRSDDGDLVLAFRGTNEGIDWKENLQQGVGQTGHEATLPPQYQQAVDLTNALKANLDEDITLTGHSLGGGLATAASVATNTPAVVYNGAGLSDETQRIIGDDLVDKNQHQVINFNDTRDPLNNLNGNMQHTTIGGDSLGTIYWIDHSGAESKSLNPIENHGLGNMSEQLGIK